MRIEELAVELGKRIGVAFKVENSGCTFSVDGMEVSVQGIDELGVISTYGEIGDPPPQGLEKLLSSMLEANHLFKGTAGCTISRDPDTGKFFLCRIDTEATTDVDGYMHILEQFINTLEVWRKILADYRSDDATDEPPVFGSVSGFMQI